MEGKKWGYYIALLKKHHFPTYSHCVRTAKLTFLLGRKLKLSSKETYDLYYMGLFHDIGKICVPVHVLDKNGELNNEEWEIIKKHPHEAVLHIIGSKECKKNIYFWENIFYHHERWDGKGYPFGLKEKELPFLSTVISIADAYDAMTSQRNYKKIMTPEEALNEIISQTGKQFSPVVIKNIYRPK